MTFPLHLDVRAEAVFDTRRKNRFVLKRIWNDSLPCLGWCLTNPSDASEKVDDPTLRKVQSYARLWGYGSVTVVNGFSWCSSNPRALSTREESVATRESNFQFIVEAARTCSLFICGWGRYGLVDSRCFEVLQALREYDLYAMRLIQCGQPEHPLYLPLKLTPVPFRCGELVRRAG